MTWEAGRLMILLSTSQVKKKKRNKIPRPLSISSNALAVESVWSQKVEGRVRPRKTNRLFLFCSLVFLLLSVHASMETWLCYKNKWGSEKGKAFLILMLGETRHRVTQGGQMGTEGNKQPNIIFQKNKSRFAFSYHHKWWRMRTLGRNKEWGEKVHSLTSRLLPKDDGEKTKWFHQTLVEKKIVVCYKRVLNYQHNSLYHVNKEQL